VSLRIRAPKDFWSGLLCVVVAAAFIVQARSLAIGTASRMGPGYFPTMLALVLAAVGAILIARSLYMTGDKVARLNIVPLFVLVVAILAFGVVINWLGLVIAGALVAIIGGRAGPEFRTKEVVALAVVLVAFSVAVFVYALGLPLKVWPSFGG
jgi:putative tricarboxylic transport membrane protein